MLRRLIYRLMGRCGCGGRIAPSIYLPGGFVIHRCMRCWRER